MMGLIDDLREVTGELTDFITEEFGSKCYVRLVTDVREEGTNRVTQDWTRTIAGGDNVGIQFEEVSAEGLRRRWGNKLQVTAQAIVRDTMQIEALRCRVYVTSGDRAGDVYLVQGVGPDRAASQLRLGLLRLENE
jgi:hypothetical protein